MQTSVGVVTLALLAGTCLSPSATAAAVGAQANPLGKVIEMIDDLSAKITADGEAEAKAFQEYMEWCDDESKGMAFELKTATSRKEALEATIEKAAATIQESAASISELAAAISTAEGELKDATLIREKENGDFRAAEAELVDSVDTLDRAIGIIQQELAKNPALVQVDTTGAQRLMQSVSAVIDAASFAGSDRRKLLAMVQSRETATVSSDEAEAQADEAKLGAPDPAAYQSKSGSIVDILEDLKEKGEAELSALRKAEMNSQHNFDTLKMSIEDQKAADEKDMSEAKTAKTDAESTKATAEGDLALVTKDLANAEKSLKTCQQDCMEVAADHEATLKSRAEELEAIATAKKILQDTTAGAVSQSYGLLFQISDGLRIRSRGDLMNAEIVSLLKKLARKHHSTALAQLASKVTAVLRYGAASGEDPFAKVKNLIQELIDKLVKEAQEEASEKAYCDEEMSKTETKRDELSDDVAKLTSKIDKAAAASAKAKDEVKEAQADLAALAKRQAEMDKVRQDQHAAYKTAKADLELGLGGVRKALEVLRAYYEGEAAAMLQDESTFGSFMQQPPKPEKHSKSGGAGGGIIDILEVCEADFAKSLSEEETAEATAESEYEKVTQENKMTKMIKEQDVKYKTQEYKSLDKAVTEMNSDRATAKTELGAVLEYYEKLKDRCVAKPEPYEERKKRREAEIAGLKEGLRILEEETAFLQRGKREARASLRR